MITISGFRTKPVIVREFGKVVDMLRGSGTITTSYEVAGRYTIESSGHGLNDYEVITIDSADYVVDNVTTDTFDINAHSSLDFTGLEWKEKAPYYEFGHPNDIVSVLAEKNKSGVYQYQKYPLIALFQDFSENNKESGMEASLNIIIANRTQPTYHANERYEKNFEPILYPIWEQLERALIISKNIQFLNKDDYTKIDRLYWGKQGLYGNEGNIFDDHIDAIEIQNLNLRFNTICK